MASSELFVFDNQPPEVDLYPTAGVLADRAAALAADLAGPVRVVPLAHWSKPETLSVDLTVVVADGPEVDRVITDHLLRHDQPHLLVRSLGDAAWVGPLVIPGRTSCVRCADLTRRDADPDWPIVLAQLGRLRLPVPGLLTGWAASVAAAQALAFLGGRVPEAAGATLELTADLRHRAASLARAPGMRLWLGRRNRMGLVSDTAADRESRPERDSLARSAFRRSARLASLPLGFAGRATLGLGKRLGGAPAEQVSEQMQQRAAEHLFRVLGELKGGAMKFGQALSLFESVLPEDIAAPYRAHLSRLQDAAPPMPTSRVHAVLARELGPRLAGLVSRLQTRCPRPRPRSARYTGGPGPTDGRLRSRCSTPARTRLCART